MLFLFEQEEAVRRYGNRKLQEGMKKANRDTARRIFDEETGDDKESKHE